MSQRHLKLHMSENWVHEPLRSPLVPSSISVWWWKLLCCVRLSATPWTVARQPPLSMGFSRQEHWSGLPFPSPGMIFPTQGSNLGFLHCRQSLSFEPPGNQPLGNSISVSGTLFTSSPSLALAAPFFLTTLISTYHQSYPTYLRNTSPTTTDISPSLCSSHWSKPPPSTPGWTTALSSHVVSLSICFWNLSLPRSPSTQGLPSAPPWGTGVPSLLRRPCKVWPINQLPSLGVYRPPPQLSEHAYGYPLLPLWFFTQPPSPSTPAALMFLTSPPLSSQSPHPGAPRWGHSLQPSFCSLKDLLNPCAGAPSPRGHRPHLFHPLV